MTSIAYHLFNSQLNIINLMKKMYILSIVQTNLLQSHQMGNINNQPTRSTSDMIRVNLFLQQQIFQGSKSNGKSSSSISSFILNANDLVQNSNNGNGPILKQKRKSNIFSKKYWFLINRSSRRKRGMASNPLFILPDFFCIFPMSFPMATLGLKEM